MNTQAPEFEYITMLTQELLPKPRYPKAVYIERVSE